MNIGKLIIVRHHESEWNKAGVWTGSRDVHLTEHGFRMSEHMGTLLAHTPIDHAFVSMQIRSFETLLGIEATLHAFSIPVSYSSGLNERDYGDYTGKNKEDMRGMMGEDEFNELRRAWDCPVPGGETLKMVYERAVPVYLSEILPLLRNGKNVLIVSHGNTIRSLMKYIEQISDDGIKDVEMLFGSILIYSIDERGHSTHKEELHANE